MASQKKVPKRIQNKERTKKAILKAALALFKKQGFHKATTKQISQRAKIAEGTLFNYFKSKEDLALYFFEKEIEHIVDTFKKDQSLQEGSLEEQLFSIVYRQLEYIAPYEDFISAAIVQGFNPQSRLNPFSLDSQRITLDYMNFIRQVLAKAEERGEIPALGDIGPYLVWFFYIGVVLYWLNDRSEDKEKTLSFIDRGITLGVSLLRRGGAWQW
jgi:AcrR family transcriptional regulator